MNKPDWFKLIEDDEPTPYVKNKIPFAVMFAITIGVAAFIFLLPSKTGEQKPEPTIATIIEETPNVNSPAPKPTTNNPIIDPRIKNPMLSNDEEDEDDNEEEDDEHDDDSED